MYWNDCHNSTVMNYSVHFSLVRFQSRDIHQTQLSHIDHAHNFSQILDLELHVIDLWATSNTQPNSPNTKTSLLDFLAVF